MEQPVDMFAQKRMELMIDMATKKLQQELNAVKEQMASLHNELGSLKSQLNRVQFSKPAVQVVQGAVQESFIQQQPVQEKRNVEIVDCRPEDQRPKEFISGAARNSEPLRPRFGDYKPEDVSIEKMFYFGRK
ncbi:MAG TPA: hypothetical protein VI564_00460 [Candidatus Nanoarchaeia archaeon]|nr:hypothetical protein [Candidatus Nanoarchaeia archaeon]